MRICRVIEEVTEKAIRARLSDVLCHCLTMSQAHRACAWSMMHERNEDAETRRFRMVEIQNHQVWGLYYERKADAYQRALQRHSGGES